MVRQTSRRPHPARCQRLDGRPLCRSERMASHATAGNRSITSSRCDPAADGPWPATVQPRCWVWVGTPQGRLDHGPQSGDCLMASLIVVPETAVARTNVVALIWGDHDRLGAGALVRLPRPARMVGAGTVRSSDVELIGTQLARRGQRRVGRHRWGAPDARLHGTPGGGVPPCRSWQNPVRRRCRVGPLTPCRHCMRTVKRREHQVRALVNSSASRAANTTAHAPDDASGRASGWRVSAPRGAHLVPDP